MASSALPASFRDPAGFVFKHKRDIYRQVNAAGESDYRVLMDSGLYEDLIKRHLLIPHKEINNKKLSPVPADCHQLIKPEIVPFISYPYEWSFSQLKDAALATLKIARLAIEHDASLKDASAYNIQFVDGKPTLIDTLSFEAYQEGKPWVAYRQFCQHFLAPLALMANTDIRLGKLLREYIDGVPLDLAVKLLPRKAKVRAGIYMHLVLHARAQNAKAKASVAKNERRISKRNLLALIESLERITNKLNWQPKDTEWGEYYSFTNYTDKAFKKKRDLVIAMVKSLRPNMVWDLGGNTGEFSRPLRSLSSHTVCFDVDPAAVEKNYRTVKEHRETNLLPLLIDLTNPSGGIGWANSERESLVARGPADVVLALALIHHLAISNNLPLDRIAAYLAELGEYAIVEFVPKGDSKVDTLLLTRKDIFPNYSEEGFEAAIASTHRIVNKEPIRGSKRTLYLLKRKTSRGR